MIQRIQSILLFFAAVVMGALFAPSFSFASVEGDTTTMKNAAQSMMGDGVFNIYDHVIMLALVGVGTLLVFVSIFLFRNRPLQLRLNRIGMAAGILVVILAAIFFYQDYQMMDTGQYLISIDYGVLAPIIFIVLVIIASRFIRKDENLVRSMDRLR